MVSLQEWYDKAYPVCITSHDFSTYLTARGIPRFRAVKMARIFNAWAVSGYYPAKTTLRIKNERRERIKQALSELKAALDKIQ